MTDKPKKYIQIGPFHYEFTRTPPETDGEQDLGGLDFEKLVISVTDDPKYNTQILRETLIHEILHAVLYATPYHTAFSDEEEENLIRSISPLLTQALIQIKEELFDNGLKND
jgi:hypothetical protein